MKKIITLIIVSILIMSGCTEKTLKEEYTNTIQELEEEITTLKTRNEEMKKLIDINKKEKDNFFILSNMSLQFVRAHAQGNIKEMRELLSEEISIVEKNNKILATMTCEEIGNIEWTLYDKNSQYIYKDMVLHGYNYLPDDDVYHIYIREFYNDSNGNLKMLPTYLGLDFKQINGVWKIIDLEIDL